MDRIIQPYTEPGPAAPAIPVATPHHHPHHVIHIHPPKSAADFLRAIRRSIPFLVIVTAVIGGAGAAYVVKLPAVFRATGQILIEPPRFDSTIAVILSNGNVPTSDRETNEKYVPNRVAQLTGRRLAEDVILQSDLGAGQGFEGDPASEIMGTVSSRKLPGGPNIFEVSLEGGDPGRVYKLLDRLLYRFEEKVKAENGDKIENAKDIAQKNINAYQSDIAKLDAEIHAMVKQSPIFAPGGKNILQEDYTSLYTLLTTKRNRYEDLKYEAKLASLYPQLKSAAPQSKYQVKIDRLLDMKERYEKQLDSYRGVIRDFEGDPASKKYTKLLKEANEDLEKLYALEPKTGGLPNLSEMAQAHAIEEIRRLEREVKDKLNEVQASLPRYQEYLTKIKQREQKEASLATMNERLGQFQMVSATTSSPVEIILKPTEPTGPSRPNRPMMIAGITMLGLCLGIGLVCAREFLDHSVKAPEHLTRGLGLPLFGVIPRIRRLALTHRGGHLWTHAAPNSLEADAYRNLRASLLGLTGRNGPVVTLLVTSAKAGEGKSTTALNLAATCARAGERTLLMDVDLRRPSLGDVFEADGANVGLVDVLKGDMPWQQAVIRTDLPNLNFLPTGDPTGVPIEILGTLELRQLIAAVSKQYHRVILDGPAILGLADCRMLGRAADAAILVVRSGAHDIRPLQRAKDMLEQSRVAIAGVVFNGLSEDLENWSSYGTGSLPAPRAVERSASIGRGLDGPEADAVAASAADSNDL